MANLLVYTIFVCILFNVSVMGAEQSEEKKGSLVREDSTGYVSVNYLEHCFEISEKSSALEVFNNLWSLRDAECIVFYAKLKCNGRSTRFVMPDKGSNYPINFPFFPVAELEFALKEAQLIPFSFRDCKYDDIITEILNNLVFEQTLCTCRNTDDIRPEEQTIVSRKQYIFGYAERNCKRTIHPPIFFSAGLLPMHLNSSPLQEEIENNNDPVHRYKILSIGPDPSSSYYKDDCISLQATITSIDFNENERKNNEYLFKIPLGSVFIDNYNKVSVSDSIQVSWEFRNSLELNIDNALRSVKDVKIPNCSSIIIYNNNVNMPNSTSSLDKFDLCKSLEKAYDRKEKADSSLINPIIQEHLNQFSINQRLVVPKCTKQAAVPFIKVIDSVDISFSGIAKITGMSGDKNMTAQEIRDYLGTKMHYAGIQDAHTLLMYTGGYAKTTLGITTHVNITNVAVQCDDDDEWKKNMSSDNI